MSLFKKKLPEPLRPCAYCKGTPKLCRCGDHREFLVYLCSVCYETPVRLNEARVSEKGARQIYNKRTAEAERIIRTCDWVRERLQKEESNE